MFIFSLVEFYETLQQILPDAVSYNELYKKWFRIAILIFSLAKFSEKDCDNSLMSFSICIY